jgi:hypothetical protein
VLNYSQRPFDLYFTLCKFVTFKVILNVTINKGCLLGWDAANSGICYLLVNLSILDSIHVIYSLKIEVVSIVGILN